MAQIERNKANDHYFIRSAEGTWQISEEGIKLLIKWKRPLPLAGEKRGLDSNDYRRLKMAGYLNTLGEYYEKSEKIAFTFPTPETKQYGPSLLLRIDSEHSASGGREVSWRLLLKLNELDEDGQKALQNYYHQCGAVAIGVLPSIQSMVGLRCIGDIRKWPEVSPKTSEYKFIWQNKDQKIFELKEAKPACGLRNDWPGNIFFRFTDNGLPNVWKRYLPGMSIAASSVNELYWLAQSDQEPEPEWPGEAQRVGPPNLGWQLWHLQWYQEHREEVAEWLWYRQIDLRPPGWRLYLLNPLSRVLEHSFICPAGQQILMRCDPPVQSAENGSANVFLSLKPHLRGAIPRCPLPESPVRSQRLISHSPNYLRFPAPPANQEYRISLDGETSGSSLWIQATPLPAKQPDWLYGLRCSLTIAGKRYTARAFRDEPTSRAYVLFVQKHFLLEQLARASWSYQPCGLPCLLRWKHLSVQGMCYQESGHPLSTDQGLTTWWQSYIWPAVAESSWVKLTLDAGSFGRITLHLVLKEQGTQEDVIPSVSPQHKWENVALSGVLGGGRANSSVLSMETTSMDSNQKMWWMNPQYTAVLFWLSRVATQETTSAQQATSPELSRALERLSVPDMPEALKHALTLLAEKRSLPLWISLRLESLLADICSTFRTTSQERR